jgi:hypothetical protein
VALVSRAGVVLDVDRAFDTAVSEAEVEIDGASVGSNAWVLAASAPAAGALHELSATSVRATANNLAFEPRVPITTVMRGPANFSVSMRPGKAIVVWQEQAALVDALGP